MTYPTHPTYDLLGHTIFKPTESYPIYNIPMIFAAFLDQVSSEGNFLRPTFGVRTGEATQWVWPRRARAWAWASAKFLGRKMNPYNSWSPRLIAFSWFIPPIAMVYGTCHYNY